MFYPYWEATVDGKSAEILQADTAFRAIFIESGQHRIEMQFRPPIWPIALTISILTVVVVSSAVVILARQRRT
jgi:uncharacterized membrane protein YfhO